VFGAVSCTRMSVSCELAAGESFAPMSDRELERRGVTLATGSP
jgi:hypothetical protein